MRRLSSIIPYLVLWALLGCSGASGDSMPVSLPVPFSGSFTGETNVVVAEGLPTVGGGLASLKGIGKSQALENAPITWNLFSDRGTSRGSLSLFPGTMADLQVTPFSGGGVKRAYTISVCVDLFDGGQTCSSNFQCYELPTDYVPSFSANTVVPDDPGATAVVRKVACSGNNDTDGQLVDARFLMGMVQVSSGDFIFYSQHDSPLFLQGSGFNKGSGPSVSKVVSTVLYQGGDVHLPLPPDSNLLSLNATPLFLPGSQAAVGTKVEAFKEFVPISPDAIQVKTDVSLLIGNSTLQINNAVTLVQRIPEVEDTVRELVATQFADDPAVTPALLENGQVFFNTVAGTADPINCDPSANEANGVFRDLCDQYGVLTAQLFCFIFVDLETFTSVSIQGTYVILRP